jgi:hypothetical protein
VGNYGSLKQLGLASAVTMRENTHLVQAGAQNEELPGRPCKRSYISQNIYCSSLMMHGGFRFEVHYHSHYTTEEGVFNGRNQVNLKVL